MRMWEDREVPRLDLDDPDLYRRIHRADRQFGITVGVLFILACVAFAVVVVW